MYLIKCIRDICKANLSHIKQTQQVNDEIVPVLLLASCCLSSSDVEDAVYEPHFLFTVLGMLQLSRYLQETQRRWMS